MVSENLSEFYCAVCSENEIKINPHVLQVLQETMETEWVTKCYWNYEIITFLAWIKLGLASVANVRLPSGAARGYWYYRWQQQIPKNSTLVKFFSKYTLLFTMLYLSSIILYCTKLELDVFALLKYFPFTLIF